MHQFSISVEKPSSDIANAGVSKRKLEVFVNGQQIATTGFHFSLTELTNTAFKASPGDKVQWRSRWEDAVQNGGAWLLSDEVVAPPFIPPMEDPGTFNWHV